MSRSSSDWPRIVDHGSQSEEIEYQKRLVEAARKIRRPGVTYREPSHRIVASANEPTEEAKW